MARFRISRTILTTLVAGALSGVFAAPASAANCGLYPWAPGCGSGSSSSSTATTTTSTQATTAPTSASAAAPAPAASSGGGFVFVLGFKSLHDLDPSDIGDPTENQAFAPNGDAQQHTTKGLMAWRKADNWTAFTNGYMTWINGPSGLVSRLNTQRCSFEGDAGNFPTGDCGGGAQPAPAPQAAPATNGSGCLPDMAGLYAKETSQRMNPMGVMPQMPDRVLLTLGSDCTWALNGGAMGTWSTTSIAAQDWSTWNIGRLQMDTKIVLNGFPDGTAQGPIKMSTAGGASYIYALLPAPDGRGEFWYKYTYNSNPCGMGSGTCSGALAGGLAQSMMRQAAALGAANVSI